MMKRISLIAMIEKCLNHDEEDYLDYHDWKMSEP
jgi:hypothetical protein